MSHNGIVAYSRLYRERQRGAPIPTRGFRQITKKSEVSVRARDFSSGAGLRNALCTALPALFQTIGRFFPALRKSGCDLRARNFDLSRYAILACRDKSSRAQKSRPLVGSSPFQCARYYLASATSGRSVSDLPLSATSWRYAAERLCVPKTKSETLYW